MHGLNTLIHLNQAEEARLLITRAREEGYYVVSRELVGGLQTFAGKHLTQADAEQALAELGPDVNATIHPPTSALADLAAA